MKARDSGQPPFPYWVSEDEGAALLVTPCLACWDYRGSGYNDGSGVCEGCDGAGWHVLAMESVKPVQAAP